MILLNRKSSSRWDMKYKGLHGLLPNNIHLHKSNSQLNQSKLNNLNGKNNINYWLNNSPFYIQGRIHSDLLKSNHRLEYICQQIKMNTFQGQQCNQYRLKLFPNLLSSSLSTDHKFLLVLLVGIEYIYFDRMYIHQYMKCMYFKLCKCNYQDIFNNVEHQRNKNLDSVEDMNLQLL